jgi:hypothetical protein
MRETRTSEPALIGDIVAVHRLTSDCLMLLAWSEEPLTSEGLASFKERGRGSGRFRAVSWSAGAPRPPSAAAAWYLIATRISGADEAQPGDQIALQSAGSRRQVLARLPEPLLAAGEFVSKLVSTLGPQNLAVATFLRQTFTSRGARPGDEVGGFVAEFFRRAAHEDGVIEIVGATGGGAVLLQGWSGGLPAGTSELVLEAEGLASGRLQVAEFHRSDLSAPARGIIGLATAEGIAPDSLKALYFVVAGELRRIRVLPERLVLDQGEAAMHLRAVMPSLKGEERFVKTLRQIARVRYTGHETLSSTHRPIAAAVDLAVTVAGSGFYVTGWFLDPAAQSSSVALRSTADLSARIDLSWTRVARPDVIAGFAGDPRFHGALGATDLVGFSVFLPSATVAESARYYLEIELADECLFLPVALGTGDSAEGRRRILESVDLHKPTASEVIQNQIGPLLRGSAANPAAAHGHAVLAGDPARKAATAIVLPAVGPSPDVKVTLAQFGVDPLSADEHLVIVCSAEASETSLRAIARALEFYGIPGALVRSNERLDHCEALTLGARLTTAPHLLFLTTSVFGRRTGWVGALRRAGKSLGEADAVSPTILYEDFSVKFSGIDAVEPIADAPYVRVDGPCVGYSSHWLAGRQSRKVLAGAIECCLVTRAAFDAIGGFGGNYALPDLKGLDFFLRLRAAGGKVFWTPEVDVVAVDDGASGEAEYWARVGQLADGWMLAATLRDTAAAPPVTIERAPAASAATASAAAASAPAASAPAARAPAASPRRSQRSA